MRDYIRTFNADGRYIGNLYARDNAWCFSGDINDFNATDSWQRLPVSYTSWEGDMSGLFHALGCALFGEPAAERNRDHIDRLNKQGAALDAEYQNKLQQLAAGKRFACSATQSSGDGVVLVPNGKGANVLVSQRDFEAATGTIRQQRQEYRNKYVGEMDRLTAGEFSHH